MGNSTVFCRLSVDALEGWGAVLADQLEREGFTSLESLSPPAALRRLGDIDSIGSFFDELAELAPGSPLLEFFAGTRRETAAHLERLPPSLRRLAMATSATVLTASEASELVRRLKLLPEGSGLHQDLKGLVQAPLPREDEIDLWLTQGADGTIELAELPEVRTELRPGRASGAFERRLKLVLLALAAAGVVAIIVQIFRAT